MATQTPPKGTCTHCGKSTSTHCKACTDIDDNDSDREVTYHCNNVCQKNDWTSHSAVCRAAQLKKVAMKKLFRAGDLLQEVFMATRVHTIDINVVELREFNGGKYIIIEGLKPPGGPVTLTPGTTGDPDDPQSLAVPLSCCAGGDVLTGMMHHLGKQVFQGLTAHIEEVDVEVQCSRILVRRRLENAPRPPLIGERSHHIILVTMKDGSKWAVDLAGAQHGQRKPILRYADYKRDYIAKITGRRPYGASAEHPARPILKRNPKTSIRAATPLLDNMEYQIDELEEWIFHNMAVSKILEANDTQYQALKKSLVDCLATAALEHVKLACLNPTSKAKPIVVIDRLEGPGVAMSEEDRGRMERKRLRRLAEMDPSGREMFEDVKSLFSAVYMV